MKYIRRCFGALLLLILHLSISAQIVESLASPASVSLNRERGKYILSDIKEVLKERYYDKKFRGIDLDERFKAASDRIKTMNTNSQIFRVIAQVLLEFNDSHTRFIPPGRANRVEYGFTTQFIGQKCFVTDVKKGSDAEAKGLKVGDVIVGAGKCNVTRPTLWKINYLIYALDPQPEINIFVLNEDGSERELIIRASFKSIKDREKEAEKRRNEKRENPYLCSTIGADVVACKLRTFSVDKKFIDKMMAEIANKPKLILDLRGNGGGFVKIEEYLTGHFFDRDVKIADFVMRDKTRERIAKTQKNKVFRGEVVILIDSNSASASEVFSRVMQIEKRGIVVGDVSAGAVMTSISMGIPIARGTDDFLTYSVFGFSVTIADLIMSDGNRLENVGVTPDHPVGPTGFALANRTDPVLSFAADLLGAKISPEDAGKLNFIHKKPEDDDDETDDSET